MPLLKGLRVLDLSRVLAGPYAAQILADLGAEVVKIEEPKKGDETRSWGPPFINGTSVYYLSANRNKKITQIDFNNSKDLQKLLHLVSSADIIIENFRAGTLKRFGLDYRQLKKKNPKLIYVSITGFGQTGPYKDKPGYDLLIQAMGGIMSITGPDPQTPTKVGIAITDITTALYTVIAILAAVHERAKTKKGRYFDISLFDTQISWLCHRLMNFLVTGKPEKALGNDHPNIVPYGVFATKDKPIVLAVGNDGQFKKLCQCLNSSWHSDKNFATNPMRVKNRVALKQKIEKVLKKKPRNFWLKKLDFAGVPAGPINDFRDLTNDPQVRARRMILKGSRKKPPSIKNPIL